MNGNKFHLYVYSLPCHLTMLVAVVVGCHPLIVCRTLPWSVSPSFFPLTMHSEPGCMYVPCLCDEHTHINFSNNLCCLM